MSSKKILITGCDGQLGSELLRCAPDNITAIATDAEQLDITDAAQVREHIGSTAPDWVINCAAYTAVDKAEDDRDTAFRINHLGAQNLAQALTESGGRMLQVSTDFVFDGTQGSPYAADAPTHPLSVYGDSKRQGEIAVSESLGDRALVVRTSWLYSSHGNNFVKTILRLLADKPELGIIADQIGTPTWAAGLAGAAWKMIELDMHGMHHWSDAGVASWYDFAVAIRDEALQLGLLSSDTPIRAIATSDYPTPARRPPYSLMDKQPTWNALGYQPPHWRASLQSMLKELTDDYGN